MKVIPPGEISGKINTLIDDAKRELIIVSPYNDMSSWKNTYRAIEHALKRGVDVAYFVRKGEHHKGLDGLGIDLIEIERLHAKLYMNESYSNPSPQ